ncbi:multicopper oxidase domain-containing protein [Phycicoccus sp. HDW14]|uniref:multicopper oxidase domain-containing protein n=1 Tax=Phycicoccus sp. HDW14 TaxID=2714941 RepID=UPI0014092F48|nr:multicopper oxidase domain-containing protein [Phycicoccus sp. HDW14]QIM21796.1 multicopper oxidase domain-containing protein [Phycicoccus sp. HDW14]
MSTSTRPASRGRFPLRDRPGLVWLALAVLVALAHPVVPAAGWLMVHLVLLGAMTHSAMVWSTHFTQALLKTPEALDDRARQNRRILVLLVGAALVLVGVPSGWWPLTVTGASGVALTVALHGWALWRRLRHALPGRFRITVRYYLAAAACVPVGAGFGAWLARGLDDEWHGRVLVAHSMTMVLGWLGLTVTGTLVTLWPTMLRTRMDERAERLARQALPVLAVAVAVTAGGAVAGLRAAAVLGLALYLAGLAWWGRALLAPARQAPPRTVATVSVTAAMAWGVVALVVLATRLALADGWAEVAEGYDALAAVLAVGFAAQLLSGALAHLIPVVLGGGPSVVRAAAERFDRAWATRLVVVNAGLALCLLPVPGAVRVAVSVLVLAALAAFVPLLLAAVRAAVAARHALLAGLAEGSAPTPPAAGRSGVPTGQLVAGVAALALAASLGVAADPAAAGLTPVSATTASGLRATASGTTPTGHTTRVRVEAHDMSYVPASIDVPHGDRLVIDLVNTDDGSPHDLTFDDDLRTRRVMPGSSATLDVGVVGGDAEGWCSVVGHRQMGMVLQVHAVGARSTGPAAAQPRPSGSPPSAASPVDLSRPFGSGFRAVDATLPPLTPERVHHVTLRVEEVDVEVAPGVRQRRWTYNGSVPGPTLHGRVGDTFVVTLVNASSMGHSVDVHAGEAVPDDVMRTVPPGASLTYRFTARRAGVWMYHCSTMPMSAHIAAGMHGAVVIEPDGLPVVDRSYLLVQSEVHLDGDGRSPAEVDAASAAADTPDLVVFDGVANQYVARPLTARTGERVRFWVLAAGPNRGSAFHVVGAQFDTVWSEGAYLLDHGRGPTGSTGGGSQVLALAVAQGGFVELDAGTPGHYPFVTHAMADAERGARGLLTVTP